MAFIWTPEAIEPIFEGPETAKNVTFNISVAGDPEAIPPSEPTITAYQITGSNSLQAKAKIEQTATAIILSFADFDGALPILAIDYQLINSATVQRVFDWQSLPGDSIQLINYQKDPLSPKTLTLKVSASDATGETESAIYQITVHADYSPGKEKLLEMLAR